MIMNTEEFGRIELRCVPLPAGTCWASATYTPSGRVLVAHRITGDAPDQFHLFTCEDDGTGCVEVFTGRIRQHPKANGIRFMVFPDNRRVMLGDQVLEATPDLDRCDGASLLPVTYPWGLPELNAVTHHWSEVIVAPDGEHIAWTILRTDMGAAAAVGRLRRTESAYMIDEPAIISTVDDLVPDPDRPGYLLPQTVRGGEVKQFVRGGTAISIVGAVDGFLPDSCVQDLVTGEVERITLTTGYDETTIFSPDERLGLVMTTRASEGTDLAVLGHLPRPHALLVGMSLGWAAYTYAVTAVRRSRPGNVGPSLIDVQRSRTDPGYRGVSLHDPGEEWVYVSPMSWHPDGRRGMWMETLRGHDDRLRVRLARLLDHEPATPVPPRPTPEPAGYGLSGPAAAEALSRPPAAPLSGRIAGRASGFATYDRRPGDLSRGLPGSAAIHYHGYSDDGATTYDGTESATSSFVGETVYAADLEATGAAAGSMHVRAVWSALVGDVPASLRFDDHPVDGEGTRGSATYGGVTLEMGDLTP